MPAEVVLLFAYHAVLYAVPLVYSCAECWEVQIFRETGVLPRGLTHPTAVPPPAQAKPHDRPRERDNAISRALGTEAGSVGAEQPRFRSGDRPAAPARDGMNAAFLARWGAVPVGPKELISLLRAGETAMLFPGGATEVRRVAAPCMLECTVCAELEYRACGKCTCHVLCHCTAQQ